MQHPWRCNPLRGPLRAVTDVLRQRRSAPRAMTVVGSDRAFAAPGVNDGRQPKDDLPAGRSAGLLQVREVSQERTFESDRLTRAMLRPVQTSGSADNAICKARGVRQRCEARPALSGPSRQTQRNPDQLKANLVLETNAATCGFGEDAAQSCRLQQAHENSLATRLSCENIVQEVKRFARWMKPSCATALEGVNLLCAFSLKA